MTNEIDYKARVAKGIALLDEEYPDWVDAIDLERLNISAGNHCVTAQLAQAHMDEDALYVDGMRMLHLTEGPSLTGSYTEHGFNAEHPIAPGLPPGYSRTLALSVLQGLWEQEIGARKAQREAQ